MIEQAVLASIAFNGLAVASKIHDSMGVNIFEDPFPTLALKTNQPVLHIPKIFNYKGVDGIIRYMLKRSTTYFVLKDKQHDVCGLVQHHEPLEFSASPVNQAVDVLILSYAAPGTVQRFPMNKLGLPQSKHIGPFEGGDGEYILSEWHPWNLFNVLLVESQKENPQLMERVGVGALYKNAIEASLEPPRWTDIYLS